jgi:hypothetical protein
MARATSDCTMSVSLLIVIFLCQINTSWTLLCLDSEIFTVKYVSRSDETDRPASLPFIFYITFGVLHITTSRFNLNTNF